MQNNLHYQNQPAHEIPTYNLLAPIAINRVINEEALNLYLQRLRAYYDGVRGEPPRPALGYKGLFGIKDKDDFIRRMLVSEDFVEVNQTPWLFQHGGMRIPSEELFENVYVEAIWKRFLSHSGFGLYSR